VRNKVPHPHEKTFLIWLYVFHCTF